MNHEDYILTALEMVSAWEIPEEEIPLMVRDLSMMMANYPADEIWTGQLDNPYS